METLRFLKLLFSNVPQKYSMNIWTLETKESEWFSSSDIENVANRIQNQKNKYVGVSFIDSVTASKKGAHSRISMAEAQGLVGLWADIDYGLDGHKKGHKNPPTESDAYYLIECLPLKPTIIVHSGNGLQPWWLFNKPMIFSSDSDKEFGQKLEFGWLRTIAAVAQNNNWTLDGTFDIARVLRIPGTINAKPNSTNKVAKIAEASGQTYSVEEFERNISPEKTAAKLAIKPLGNQDIVINDSAVPNGIVFATLLTIDKKFQDSFFRKRTDAAMKDKSNSGYDLSIASIAVKANLDNQSIVDLIVASRKFCNVDIMQGRESYYLRTIEKARSGKNSNSEDSRLDPIDEFVESTKDTEGRSAEAPFNKEAALELISGTLGFKITRIIRYTSSPPNTYQINTELYGNIDMGGIDNITKQGKFRDKVADLCRILIPTFKSDKYDKLAQLILRCCEDESIAESDEDAARGWLIDYMKNRIPTDDSTDSVARLWPLYVKSRQSVYIYGDGFRQWLEQRGTAKITNKTVGMLLRAIGCFREQIGVKVSETDSGWSTRSMWKVPIEICDIIGYETRTIDRINNGI